MSQINENIEDFESFDIRKVFKFLTDHWKWIAIGVLVSLLSGFIYIRYATPEYRSTAKVLIKNESESGALAGFQLEGFGISPEGYGAESEAEILKSRQLLGNVVEELDLTTILYTYGGFTKIKKTELFEANSPIWLSQTSLKSPYFESFKVTAKATDNDKFNLKIKNGESILVESGDTIVLNGVELFFTQAYGVKVKSNQLFEFIIQSRDQAVSGLIESIGISKDQITEGILGISMRGSSMEKNNAVINELIEQQQKSAIDQKNLTAKKTNEFLAKRLALIERKLDSIENIGRAIKSKNDIIDIPSELPAMLSEERQLEEDYFELSVNEGLAKQMIEFFESNSDFQSLIPVSLSFNSNTLNSTIGEYNQLVLERNNLLASSNENNPLVVKRKNDIIRLRSNLKKSVQSYLSSLLEQKNRVQSKLNKYSSKKSSLPKYELDYRDAMRDQQISESIYLMLLQKKEENEIILASTESNIRIIDYAYSERFPVSPNKKMVIILTFLIGVLVPVAFFYIKGLLDNKVKGVEDIEKLGLPVLGEVPNSKLSLTEILDKTKRNNVTEAFISIRTNIGFILNNNSKESNVIMVTSSIAGEGKTFVTLNLAKSLSVTGKKVAVLGLDLRAPKLLEYIDVPYTVGVSNFLSNDQITLNNIIYKQGEMDGVDFIPCGTIPPNPSELLLRNRFGQLIEELKEKYDIILVDTSPIGLVADTLSIAEYADLLVYVARANYLKSEFLSLPKKLYKERKFKSLTVVLNGAENANNGYGYGYGYLNETGKKGILSKLGLKRK